MCTDRECTDGVTSCRGCNGYGVLRHTGRKFTKRGRGKYITERSPQHDECNGTGLAACGCLVLDTETSKILIGSGERS
jgi:hypothetical protein